MDLSVLIWINLQPEAPQPQVFRFEQDVFCGSCAVEGPFVREADAFFLAYDKMAADAFLAGPATMLLWEMALTRSSLVTMMKSLSF